jgi:hypothetical protein
MSRASHLVAVVAVAGLLSAVAAEREARACGGCFHPPPETPTVVTDHRMILSISKEESTLWDQIRYTGAPSSFAWVLPISGTVRVGLSADSLFGNLDQLTSTLIVQPAASCPPRPASHGCSSTTDAQSASGRSPFDPAVEVTKREVVGPYESVQLKATDAKALETWLTRNGFVVPPDVQPVVDQYVAEKFDFLALRLLPGKGIQDMRPVRVTTPGANVVLPLRMVAAGTGPVVGITLWIVGEGRYEPQNFPSFRIKDEELVWDWTANRSNYMELRAQKTQAADGRAWDLESSMNSALGSSFPQFAGYPPSYDFSQLDYLPDEQAGKSAVQAHDDDVTALGGGTKRITRLRADLSHAALAADLVVTASADQSELQRIRLATKDSGQPPCPVYDQSGAVVGTAPRDKAQEYADKNERFSCTTSSGSRSPYWLGGALTALAVTIARGWRRRHPRVVP